MIITQDQEKNWGTGQRRYGRLCKALGKDASSNEVYSDLIRDFGYPVAKHSYTFFTALAADKYAWMDGPHIEAVYRAMLVRLADG